MLHAKAVVADDEAVFMTSANLTDAAFDRNIELGVLIRDRALAASVTSHFRGLIDREVLRPLPVECSPTEARATRCAYRFAVT